MVSGFASEALCWLFVYRLSGFQRLEMALERANKKLDSAKGSGNKRQKKEQRLEDIMKASSGEIFKVQIKTTIIVSNCTKLQLPAAALGGLELSNIAPVSR